MEWRPLAEDAQMIDRGGPGIGSLYRARDASPTTLNSNILRMGVAWKELTSKGLHLSQPTEFTFVSGEFDLSSHLAIFWASGGVMGFFSALTLSGTD